MLFILPILRFCYLVVFTALLDEIKKTIQVPVDSGYYRIVLSAFFCCENIIL